MFYQQCSGAETQIAKETCSIQKIEKYVPYKVAALTAKLRYWIEDFHKRENRVLRGLVKYTLAPGYESFRFDPCK